MLYVELSTEGVNGLSRTTAKAAVIEARGMVSGKGEVTKPSPQGVYYAVFENAAVGDAFIGYLKARNVTHKVTSEAPVKIRKVRSATTAHSGHPRVVVITLGDIGRRFDELFGGPAR